MSAQLFDRLRDPIRTWRNAMGRFVGCDRLCVGSLRLKRYCDSEVFLDDDGEVDSTRAQRETFRMRGEVGDWMRAKEVGAAPMRYHYCRANSATGMRCLPFKGYQMSVQVAVLF